MLKPMLASLAEASLDDPEFAYEPKYDGIRAIVEVPAGGRGVRLWSRLGNEKTSQLLDVAAALERWARGLNDPVVLDGEVVALDAKGDPAGFQDLQRRGLGPVSRPAVDRATAFIAFDLLREGDADLRARTFLDRRAALERLFGRTGSPLLRVSEMALGNGCALYKRALSSGWEGLIAKRTRSRYTSGKRSLDWRKLKIVHEQEFVVGGWTEPRQTRAHFGALLLGVYEEGDIHRGTRRARRDSKKPDAKKGAAPLIYVGHVGTGFDERELARLMKLFKPLEIQASPFREEPPVNERPHWLRPTLVAQVKFTEWTADGHLRHPVYLGLRDDKRPHDIVREHARRVHASAERLKVPGAAAAAFAAIVDQHEAIERGKGDGSLDLPGGTRLSVTNLRKVFWPKQKFTKGDLLRYYAHVAPFILPAVADRPLVMKRFPNSIAAAPFYQHRVEHPPAGVRVETVPVDDEMRPQFVGGDVATLLHMTQLAAISQDPWFSRVQSLNTADYVALDLDPSDGVGFPQVIDVAR